MFLTGCSRINVFERWVDLTIQVVKSVQHFSLNLFLTSFIQFQFTININRLTETDGNPLTAKELFEGQWALVNGWTSGTPAILAMTVAPPLSSCEWRVPDGNMISESLPLRKNLTGVLIAEGPGCCRLTGKAFA